MARKFDVSLDQVREAKRFLDQHLKPSPLLRNTWLSETYGCEVYLKLENMQPIGSFKIRGATYRISKLTAEERACGVIAASAGPFGLFTQEMKQSFDQLALVSRYTFKRNNTLEANASEP